VRSIASGLTFTVAAGNGGHDACQTSPARVPEALTVAATTIGDLRAPFSNYGRCIDLFAPGQCITSAWATSDTASSVLDGTSMASPHVAGAAALYLGSHRRATPAEVAEALIATATTDRVAEAGPGTPNRLLFSLTLPVEDGPTASTPPTTDHTRPRETDSRGRIRGTAQ
jgi:subtilisin family serine protease